MTGQKRSKTLLRASSLFLVPCDPSTVVGSRGDEAMIYAILQDYRRRHPEGSVTIIATSSNVSESEGCRRLSCDFGASFVPAWRSRLPLLRIILACRRVKATEVYVIGADCMDGYYSPFTSLLLFAVADVTCRMGLTTRLTGFSWNEHPHPKVIRGLRHVSNKLDFFVRDPISYARFSAIEKRGRLVADTAFCLEPLFSDRVKDVLAMMEEDRRSGRFVFGVNLNPMLKVDCGQLADALNQLSRVSLYLIPHDYRDGGDLLELKKLDELLSVPHRLLTTVHSAAELKGLTLGLTALLTSRMHLGIAALDMGCPIAAFSYQGKFQGLFEEFGLSQRFVMVPCGKKEDVVEILNELISRAQHLRNVVQEKGDIVEKAARFNLLQ